MQQGGQALMNLVQGGRRQQGSQIGGISEAPGRSGLVRGSKVTQMTNWVLSAQMTEPGTSD